MFEENDEEEINPSQEYPFPGTPAIKKVTYCRIATHKLIDSWKKNQLNLSEIYQEVKEMLLREGSQKAVCAKLICKNETIAQCYDCRTDASCIICLDCFNHSNHQGHKVVIKKAYGGCCDCGDSEAWKPEGFCSKHSGKETQVCLESETVTNFLQIFEDLFYLYFRCIVDSNQFRNRPKLFNSLIKTLSDLNARGVEYTKMIATLFQKKIPAEDSKFLNHKINHTPILYNLLTYGLVGEDIRVWENLFIGMFPCYEFKKQLLVAYIEHFSQIYSKDSQKSTSYGQSLACQILTSYKLVEEYVTAADSKALGYNIEIKNLESSEQIVMVYLHDLKMISKLKEPVPLKYWMLHVQTIGLETILRYHQLLRLEAIKYKEKENTNNFIPFLAKHSKFTLLEYSVVELMAFVTNILKHQKQLLLKLILHLCKGCIREFKEGNQLLIFKPYQRVLGLALFAYFDEDLTNVAAQQEQLKLYLSENISGVEEFLIELKHDFLKTYFYFNYILTNQRKGLSSSLYYYLYFYRQKNKLLISLDLTLIKMLILLSTNQPLSLNLRELLKNQETQEPPIHLTSINLFLSTINELGLLYTSKISEIYLSKFINHKNHLYSKDILQLFSKYLTEFDGAISQEKAIEFGKDLLMENQDDIKQSLKQICDYNKEKKTFILKSQWQDEKYINFKDFGVRVKLLNKKEASLTPANTQQLISDYNKLIFDQVWCDQNIKEYMALLVEFYEQFKTEDKKDQEITLSNQVCKMYYLLKEIQTHKTVNHEVFTFMKHLIDQRILSKEYTIKMFHPFYQEYFGSKIEKNIDEEVDEKKKIMMQKKNKKLEILKTKFKQNIIDLEKDQKYKIPGKEMLDQNNDEGNFCVICRKKNSETSLVYLGRMQIRNHEKLLKMSDEGVQTLTFSSCYHVFDFECLQKSGIMKDNYTSQFKCPLCKAKANIFLSLEPNTQNIQNNFNRIMQVFHTLRDLENVELLPELVKSFYHFVLVSLYEEEYMFKKRKVFYGLLIKALKNKMFKKDLQALRTKFNKNKLIMIFDSDSVFRSQIKVYDQNELSMQSESNQEDSVSDEESDDEEEDEEFYLDEINQQQLIDEPESQGLQMLQQLQQLMQFKNSQGFKLDKKKSSKSCESNFKPYSQTFKFVINLLFDKLLQTSSETIAIQNIEMEKRVRGILNKLFDEEPLLEKGEGLPLEKGEGLPLEKGEEIEIQKLSSVLTLREMPPYYYWDEKLNQCDYCHQISAALLICMLCKWKGCLNCKNGGSLKHTKFQHGEVGLYIDQHRANLHILRDGELKKLQCLYKNGWGDDFNIKEDWKNYEFDEKASHEAIKALIRDD